MVRINRISTLHSLNNFNSELLNSVLPIVDDRILNCNGSGCANLAIFRWELSVSGRTHGSCCRHKRMRQRRCSGRNWLWISLWWKNVEANTPAWLSDICCQLSQDLSVVAAESMLDRIRILVRTRTWGRGSTLRLWGAGALLWQPAETSVHLPSSLFLPSLAFTLSDI